MSDSRQSDGRAANAEANRGARLDAVARWAAYVREQPPSVWGPQQNELVNAQLESARAADLSAAHRRRVAAFGEAMTADATGSEPADDDADRSDADE